MMSPGAGHRLRESRTDRLALVQRGHAKTAEAALESALIYRRGNLGRLRAPLVLRSDNGLGFTSRTYSATV